MAAQDPYGDMTQQFLELWQKQWASVMSDKQFIHAMLGVLSSMQQGAYGTTGNQAPASHSAAASDVDERLAELARRLAECEKRLARLESAASKPEKRPAKPATSRRKPRK